MLATADRARRDREVGQTSLFELVETVEEKPTDFGLAIDVQPMASDEKLRLEKELLGLYLSDHPVRRIAADLARLTDTQAVEVTSEIQGTEIRVGGLVKEVRRVVTRKGQIMAYAQIEDLTGSVDVILFPRTYEEVRKVFEPEAVVVVAGKVDIASGSNRGGGGGGGAGGGGELEEDGDTVEPASVVADSA